MGNKERTLTQGNTKRMIKRVNSKISEVKRKYYCQALRSYTLLLYLLSKLERKKEYLEQWPAQRSSQYLLMKKQ